MIRIYIIVSVIELVILFLICRSIDRIAVSKDRSSTKYITYTILLWFGLQGIFYALGFVLFKILPLAFLFGLVGAAIGGLIAYRIANRSSIKYTNYKEVD